MANTNMKFVLAWDIGISRDWEFNDVPCEARGPNSFSEFPAARATMERHPHWVHSVLSDREGRSFTFDGRISSADVVFFFDPEVMSLLRADMSARVVLVVAVCFRATNTTSIIRTRVDDEYTPSQVDYYTDFGDTVSTPHPLLTAFFSTVLRDGIEENFE